MRTPFGTARIGINGVMTGARTGAMLAGNTGKSFMRNTFILAVMILLLSLPGAAEAKGIVTETVAEVEMRGIVGEACFGDRYETDEDMNDGNRITEEEILRLINPPRS